MSRTDNVGVRERALRDSLSLSSETGFLVTGLNDIRWLSGFTGSNGCISLSQNGIQLFTDSRYTEQAARQCPGLEVRTVAGNVSKHGISALEKSGVSRCLFQPEQLTAGKLISHQRAFPQMEFEGSDPFPCLRAVKDGSEIQKMRFALKITEQVFEEMKSFLRPGVSEREVASQIDYRQRCLGADASSFETIVAFGSNSSLPHATPGPAVLEHGQPILIDFGCICDGYMSDMTRTMHLGEPSSEFVRAYSAVQGALQAVSEQATSGVTGNDLDAIARLHLQTDGYEDYFLHSLGHGVGLDIHEWPTLSKRGETLLPEDCVVTFEPGVYIADEFGIRIENMAILRENTAQIINTYTTDLVIL